MKYKVGQKVKILANNNNHDFNIGDEVVINKAINESKGANYPHIDEFYKAGGWWLLESDIELSKDYDNLDSDLLALIELNKNNPKQLVIDLRNQFNIKYK